MTDTSNFDTPTHALLSGMATGYLSTHGMDVAPVFDREGNYTPFITLTIPEEGTFGLVSQVLTLRVMADSATERIETGAVSEPS